uniref:Putative secreted peptide n=1 Tax=Anopheles braziliensis TaxID=58242 RepID=A0A2M3ZWY2_9DIPT
MIASGAIISWSWGCLSFALITVGFAEQRNDSSLTSSRFTHWCESFKIRPPFLLPCFGLFSISQTIL